MTNSQCEKCGKTFYARPTHIAKGWGKFCSAKCQYESFKNGDIVKCEMCGVKVYRTPVRISRSKSGKFFCGKSCQTKWRNKEFSGKKSLQWKDGHTTYRDAMLRSSIPKVCALCNEEDQRVLAVHHIDKNRKNYKVENLAWLCHNCHYLVHHDEVAMAKFMGVMSGR